MVKLERNLQTEGAIRRAAQNHNFVMMTGAGQYLVISGKSRAKYTVKFSLSADGQAGATCNCPAGQSATICHHVISAGWLHKAVCKMRKA